MFDIMEQNLGRDLALVSHQSSAHCHSPIADILIEPASCTHMFTSSKFFCSGHAGAFLLPWAHTYEHPKDTGPI